MSRPAAIAISPSRQPQRADPPPRRVPRSLPYDEVKYQALLACQALEQQGVISRADGYQAILNSIAYDIRTKNRRQIQRTKEIGTMRQALDRLREKKADLEEQIAMYNAHNAQSISNMQTKRYACAFCLPPTSLAGAC